MIFKSQRFAVVVIFSLMILNMTTKNLQQLIIHDFLRE